MEDDRRNVTRTRVLRGAKIIVRGSRHAPVIHCTVQNITSGGACLKVGNTYGVPETFDLTFESGRTRRACHVMWRTTDKLGVAFERPPTRHRTPACRRWRQARACPVKVGPGFAKRTCSKKQTRWPPMATAS